MDQNELTIDPQPVTYRTENKDKFINEYKIAENIGSGSFGKVKKVIRYYQENGIIQTDVYAMKIFLGHSLRNQRTIIYNGNEPVMASNWEFVYNEMLIHYSLKHDNIVRLWQILEDDDSDKWYLIMDIAEFGSLMTWDDDTNSFKKKHQVENFITKHLQEKQQTTELQQQNHDDNIIEDERNELNAKFIFYQVVQALIYLHDKRIAHRDIKVDNIVVCNRQEFPVKIIDFSTSIQLKNGQDLVYDCAGTPGFRPPEHQFFADEGYNPLASDVWSLGISIYTYVNEKMPFIGDSELEIDIKCKNEQLLFSKESQNLQDLLLKLCNKNYKERPTIKEVQNHKWFDDVKNLLQTI